MIDDRTVHGLTMHGSEIVRYNRAGKWWVEGPGGARMPVRIHHAARLAADETFYPRKLGGMRFDKLVRELRQERPA